MSFDIRVAAISAGLAGLVAGAMATPQIFPQAFASEPQSHVLDTAKDIFPPSFDMSRLKKFDITTNGTVSTKAERTEYVSKIAFGHRTRVAIVTTASGTYSSDALLSPNVKYPGIDVTPKHPRRGYAYSSFSGPYGSGTWSSVSSGSFTYYTYSFTPRQR